MHSITLSLLFVPFIIAEYVVNIPDDLVLLMSMKTTEKPEACKRG